MAPFEAWTGKVAMRWEARKGWSGTDRSEMEAVPMRRQGSQPSCRISPKGSGQGVMITMSGWEMADQLSGLLWPRAGAPSTAAFCRSQNLIHTFQSPGPVGDTTFELLPLHLHTLTAQVTTFSFPSVTSFSGKTNTFFHFSFIFTLNVQNWKNSFHCQWWSPSPVDCFPLKNSKSKGILG